jgi:plastocyanin
MLSRQRLPAKSKRAVLLNVALTCAIIGGLIIGSIGVLRPSFAQSVEQVRVEIKDFKFEPLTLIINSGTTVTWVNADAEPHNVINDEGLFRSGGIDTNETYSYTFSNSGIFHLTCSLHPRMVATIIVK